MKSNCCMMHSCHSQRLTPFSVCLSFDAICPLQHTHSSHRPLEACPPSPHRARWLPTCPVIQSLQLSRGAGIVLPPQDKEAGVDSDLLTHTTHFHLRLSGGNVLPFTAELQLAVYMEMVGFVSLGSHQANLTSASPSTFLDIVDI